MFMPNTQCNEISICITGEEVRKCDKERTLFWTGVDVVWVLVDLELASAVHDAAEELEAHDRVQYDDEYDQDGDVQERYHGAQYRVEHHLQARHAVDQLERSEHSDGAQRLEVEACLVRRVVVHHLRDRAHDTEIREHSFYRMAPPTTTTTTTQLRSITHLPDHND